MNFVHQQRQLVALADLVADIGEPCWASGNTAAALRAFDGFDLRPPFHILTTRDRNVRRIGHVIHTTLDLPLIDRGRVHDIPVLSATRTLIDIARSTSRQVLTAALDSAMRDGGTSEDFLHGRLNALRRSARQGPAALLAVIEGQEITRGGQSWLEREVLRLLDRAGLPKPSTQVTLARRGDRLVRVDFHFPGTRVVVEALGYRWHRSGAQLAVDAARFNELVLGGYLPLQFTYAQIVEQQQMVVSSIRRALQQPASRVPVSA